MYNIEKYIFSKFRKKYFLTNDYYGVYVVNNIIYNEKTHLVAKFKDFLIVYDFSEFLKCYYKKLESHFRLTKLFEYYEKYSKIFPNYISLKEAKYIYKNIHRKQKMIDLQQEMKNLEENKNLSQNENLFHQRKKNQQDIFFNSDAYNSIIKQSQDLYKLLFGIEKNEKENDSFMIGINEITNLIENFSKIEFKYNKRITKIKYLNNNKINMKKNNNSSLLTKQSTVNSTNNKKYINFENINTKKKNNLLIELKKYSNEKNKKLSCSLLTSQKESKKNIIKKKVNHISSNLIFEINKSDIQNSRKNKFFNLNMNNNNYISFIKEKLKRINSKYKKINKNSINEKNNKTILTERFSSHYRYNTLISESNNKQYFEKFVKNNKIHYSKNSKSKNKKSNGERNKSKSSRKNTYFNNIIIL